MGTIRLKIPPSPRKASQSAEARLWARYALAVVNYKAIDSLNPLKRGYGHDTLPDSGISLLRCLNPLKRGYGHDTPCSSHSADGSSLNPLKRGYGHDTELTEMRESYACLNPLKRGYGHDTFWQFAAIITTVSIR